jgi:hypothetical protein
MARAQSRPLRIAQTTSDWPGRMSPAENTFGSAVWQSDVLARTLPRGSEIDAERLQQALMHRMRSPS